MRGAGICQVSSNRHVAFCRQSYVAMQRRSDLVLRDIGAAQRRFAHLRPPLGVCTWILSVTTNPAGVRIFRSKLLLQFASIAKLSLNSTLGAQRNWAPRRTAFLHTFLHRLCYGMYRPYITWPSPTWHWVRLNKSTLCAPLWALRNLYQSVA